METQIQTTPPNHGLSQFAPMITAEQKQRLIDNLQFELTDRARKLRAQYARQAEELTNKIERRIIRIPQSLRNVKIGELIDLYAHSLEQQKPSSTISLPRPLEPSRSILNAPPSRTIPSSPQRYAGLKRSSEEMIYSDKENQHSLDLPKKRSRLAAVPKSATEARAARKIDPAQVLSPKSNNSRTLPYSPLKAPTSPGKSYLSRPASPIKPATASIAEKPKSVRGRTAAAAAAAAATKSTTTLASTTGSTRGRKPVPAPAKPATTRIISDTSTTSSSSAGTTIVKKTTGTRKGIISKVQGIASAARGRTTVKKAAAPVALAAPETGKRVLRSRK